VDPFCGLPRIPDLALFDFLLWSYVKETVPDEGVASAKHLWYRLTTEIATVTLSLNITLVFVGL
jgi:hypothetical protein